MKMRVLIIFCNFLLLLLVFCSSAKASALAEVYFDESFKPGFNQDQRYPSWIKSIERSGGGVDEDNEFWSVPKDSEVGEGWIAVHLDRSLLASDLAMALFVNDHESTNLAVQLFNRSGEVVAVDLFANVAESMRVAETDYLIIPLQDYEDASTVVVRRISGRVEIAGMVLFPVVGEVQSDPEIAAELIDVLGDTPSAKYGEYLQRRIEAGRTDATKGGNAGYSDGKTEAARLSDTLPFVFLNPDPKPPVDVYFIPMDFSPDLAVRLANELGEELDLHIAVSVQMGTSPNMFNSERRQYDANKIISEARTVLPRITHQTDIPYAVVLLHQDLNRPPFNLRYTFAVHSTQGISVISTARMDPRNYGLQPDDELLYSRLKKMVMKGIGYNIFGHKRSLDRSSVMYSPIMSVQDLDEIDATF